MDISIGYFFAKSADNFYEYYGLFTKKDKIDEQFNILRNQLIEKGASFVSQYCTENNITMNKKINFNNSNLFVAFIDDEFFDYEEQIQTLNIYSYILSKNDNNGYDNNIKYYRLMVNEFLSLTGTEKYISREIFEECYPGITISDNTSIIYDVIMDSEKSAGKIVANNIKEAAEKACQKIISYCTKYDEPLRKTFEYILMYENNGLYCTNCEAKRKPDGSYNTKILTMLDFIDAAVQNK